MTRTTSLLVAAALLGSLAASAPPAQAAPKQCAGGKTAWKLDGRLVCRPAPRLGNGTGPAAPAMLEAWMLSASRQAPGGRPRLPRPVRRVVPRVARTVASAAARAVSAARIAQRGPVVERFDRVLRREDLGNGVTAESHIRGRAYEDGTNELEAEVDVHYPDGGLVRWAPEFKLYPPTTEVGCPTAAGVVTVEMQGGGGGTITVMDGRRVLGAKTERYGWKVQARGQVGTDARLHSVVADVTETTKIFQRGVRIETTLTSPISVSREGAPTLGGTPAVDVRIRSARHSRAGERRHEARWARELARARAESIGNSAVRARDRLLAAEPGWYELPGRCAELDWTPYSATLEPGDTRGVRAQVIAKRDRGLATGSIALGVSRGRLIPITSVFSPAGPASFIAAAEAPDSENFTVYADAIATSTAGRAQWGWHAKSTPVSLPRRFSGTVASTSSLAGLTRTFSGSATYTRTSLVRGPDGSLTGWYELTAGSLTKAKETVGPAAGCRIEATATGGYIDSGDLEVRVLPGGAVVYALLYDLKVDGHFAPTDCPPGGLAYDGEISAFLNTRRPGPVEHQLRPAGAGYRLAANAVDDVTAVPGGTTTATWTLTPSH